MLNPKGYAEYLRDELDYFLHREEKYSHRVAVLTDPNPAKHTAVILVVSDPVGSDKPYPVICETLCTSIDALRTSVDWLTNCWQLDEEGFVRVGLPVLAWYDAGDLISAAITAGAPH